jgi:hypothetical protein
MDRKKDENSLLTNRFAPGENPYLNDTTNVSPSSAIISESERENSEEEPGESYSFLYWQ